MAGFKYVDGLDGRKHVQKTQFFRVKAINSKVITIHLAGTYDGGFNNFGFKHIMFPSKKGTALDTKALNRARRRADISDDPNAAGGYRDDWTRQAWGQPARVHDDETHGAGATKYGRRLGADSFNSYVDTTRIPLEELLKVFADGCDKAFKKDDAKGTQRDVTFKLRTTALCGVSANGAVDAPKSTLTVTVYKQAQDAYHLLHFVGQPA